MPSASVLGAHHHAGRAAGHAPEPGGELDVLILLIEDEPTAFRRFGLADDLAVLDAPVGLADRLPSGQRIARERPVGHEAPWTTGQRHREQAAGDCRDDHHTDSSNHVFPQRIETLKIVWAHDATVYAELLGVAHFGLSAKAYRPATNVMPSAFL